MNTKLSMMIEYIIFQRSTCTIVSRDNNIPFIIHYIKEWKSERNKRGKNINK